ncbi:MAG: glycosyltransferase [Anaerolineales bacterium]|nr:glycosyltransferase [Anaerolineales bacterium]
MKILYIVPYVPNPIRVRPYSIIRFLAERGHAVTLATIWSDESEREDLRSIEPYTNGSRFAAIPKWKSLWNVIKSLPGSIPLQAVYSWNPAFANQLVQFLLDQEQESPFDVIHVEHLRGALYGIYLQSALKQADRQIPVVWDSVDCISHLFRQASQKGATRRSRLLTHLELPRTEEYERWLSLQFDHVLVTSKADREAFYDLLTQEDRRPQIDILRNGVDFHYFSPNPAIIKEEASIVMSGKMSYHANVSMVLHFCNEIIPHIRKIKPYVKLFIVGKDPPREIQALGEKNGISVTGAVEDIRPYIQSATVAVSPVTYGAGIQNKVLEGMACGIPVVASPKAVSGLDIQPGKHLLVAENPETFATAVLLLLEDADLRIRIGNAGRRFVERNHDWNQIVAGLEQIYHDVINAGH